MENRRLAQSNQRLWPGRLGIAIGTALLLLVVLLCGLRGITPARADPGTLYVDGASGQDIPTCGTAIAPCQTISYTLNSRASGGDIIRVARATYTENLTINISVTLEGGYEPISWTRSITQYETIIDGSGSTTQSVVTIPAGNFDVVLDGFTVTGGDTTDNGGGVLISSDGSVIIANSVITGNISSGDGGGIAAYGPLTLTLQNVVVANNQAGKLSPFGVGGGLYFRNGLQATLTSVQVYGNTAAEGGGGIRVDDPGTSVVISDTQIYSNTALGYGGGGIGVNQGSLSLSSSSVLANAAPNNEGGGIHVSDGGSADVVNSIIADNLTKDSGGAVSTGQATVNLTNVLITGNETTSDNANVLAVNESDVTIINSTISDNNPQGAQAVILWSGNLTITNSIMWNNALNLQGDPPCPTCFTVTYSDIGGGWPGPGNIDADPRFADPANGDYHLQAWSPCIDTGTATGAPDHDFEGDARPQNAGYDMGADEFVGTPVSNQGDRYVATTGSDAGPNLCLDKTTPCQTINHALNMANPGETILVAQGIYTENLSISKPITLSGGDLYSSTGSLWLPGDGETIIDGSGSQTVWGDWDGQQVHKPAVISDSGEYKMWYDGGNLLNEVQIGLATSSDGISWTKYFDNPVLTSTSGTWNQPEGEHAPFVIKEDGVYKMWYEGTNEYEVRQLGYATSTNGIDWNEHPNNPILQAGPETYDQEVAGHGSLLNDGGTYKLWYHALGDQGAIIAHATSLDGVNWTKQGPVLLPQAGGWDEDALWGPSVLKLDGVYWMWYAAGGSQGPPAIGVVTSTNGVNWPRFLVSPVITAETPIGDPHVISDSGTLKMWYQDFEQGVIHYAESDDGVSWTPSPNPVLTPGAPGQWGGPVVRFEEGSDGSVLEGLTIQGGSDEAGGGVHATDASVTIRDCLIRDNFGHGMPRHFGAGGIVGSSGDHKLTIVNSRIIDNQVNGGAGGVRTHDGLLVITNTLVADNVGDTGIHTNGPMDLMHVTVVNNDGGVLINPESSATLKMVNSIVYNNGWGIGVERAGEAQVSHSDVEGGWPGPGNIDADPQFADPADGDYHLQGNSPAIDAGTPAGAPPADLDGTPRDTAPDMGAYEYTRFDHDVAVVDVLPSGNVAVGVAFPIRATLYNVGNLAENNVPVVCEIEHDGAAVYQQTVHSGQIQPLTWQVLEFPTYTPANQGTYTLTCQSNLAADQRPSNDTFTQTLAVLAEIADVWTKDNPDDDGDVPSGLDNWYESPDLWVRNNDDGGLIHQDPIVGVTNTVYVRLRNRGTVAISGTVDVYWIEPSLGVRCGDWAYIDTITFTKLLPGEVRIVSTPWVPTRTGHTCLQDVIDSPQDPYNRGLECAPQWVPWDNNVEWHNVNVIPNPKSGILSVQDVKEAEVQLVNVYNLPQDVDVVIERMTFPLTGTITVQLPADLFDHWWEYGARWSEGVAVFTASKEIRVTSAVSATIGAIPMQAAEKAAVGLSFDGPAGLTFEMAIRERIEGLTTGGVVYQWTIPDDTPPGVVDKSPADAATDVALDAPVILTFDEEIAPLNFNLTLTPDPGGWRTTWNDAGTMVTATHAGFSVATTYTATVTASDAAANSMNPVGWSFTTKTGKHWIYLPLILRDSGP